MKTIKNKIVYEEDIRGKLGKATAIVFPESAEEIKNLIKITEQDIIPRAGGTSFLASCLPNESIILDMSKLNMFEVDSLRKTAIVEPGVILNDLNDYLEQFNLEFPVSTLFPGIETIGAMIARNSVGSREIKYGRMANWLDSIQIINGKAEQIKISKSDLSEFTGMEGTTGVIIKANLRLTNKKSRTLTILKAETIEPIIASNKKLRLDQEVCSADILSKELSVMLGLENKYHLFVEYENDSGFFKKEDYARLLTIKEQAYSKAATEGYYLLESIKVFSDSLQDFIKFLEERQIPFFGYLASGVIFPLFKKDDVIKNKEVIDFSKKIKAEIGYGRGYGLRNKKYLSETEKNIMSRVKARYDPHFKFNRNKLIDYKLD